jgi:hypothetical protein
MGIVTSTADARPEVTFSTLQIPSQPTKDLALAHQPQEAAQARQGQPGKPRTPHPQTRVLQVLRRDPRPRRAREDVGDRQHAPTATPRNAPTVKSAAASISTARTPAQIQASARSEVS